MSFQVQDLGRLGYMAAWDIQRKALEEVLEGGVERLLLVEHDPVLTLGASFREENLLLTREEYFRLGIDVFRTDRGGDVTFHGPGQLVLYPIFNLQNYGADLHKWMRDLEEAMIRTCASFGLEARRLPPHTGAWIGDLKVAAIGVKVRRWVSHHGIALNVCNPLDEFGLIVPCGIHGYGVTSLSQEIGADVSVEEAKPIAVDAVREVFP